MNFHNLNFEHVEAPRTLTLLRHYFLDDLISCTVAAHLMHRQLAW
jgi:hypothetical protein